MEPEPGRASEAESRGAGRPAGGRLRTTTDGRAAEAAAAWGAGAKPGTCRTCWRNAGGAASVVGTAVDAGPVTAGNVSDAVIPPAATSAARPLIHVPLMFISPGAENSFEGYRQPHRKSLQPLPKSPRTAVDQLQAQARPVLPAPGVRAARGRVLGLRRARRAQRDAEGRHA